MNFLQILNEVSEFKKKEIAKELAHEKLDWRVWKEPKDGKATIIKTFDNERQARAYASGCNRKANQGTKFTVDEG